MTDEDFLPSTWQKTEELLENFGRKDQETKFHALRMAYQPQENTGVNIYPVNEDENIYRAQVETWKNPWEEGSYNVHDSVEDINLPGRVPIEEYTV